ncbi:histidine phosphatase family protein [Blastococcus sp. Marseille-P5729]|uniref:histidine phosphatase family protein n=1 Tax=Blastococcus sp. Marseille-P5729 TaxID=2086582 RepID=UPI000D11039A|nr:histidine phosphatase family protein [Blastococcus sp. Marseille-P5729]
MSLDRLLLWRHGRTDWNADGRFQGQLDTALDATGVAQAREASPYLAAERPTAVYASDLSRAAATAQVLADLLAVPVTLDPRLRETSLGGWEGLDRAEVAQRFPEEFAGWTSGLRTNPGNGETAQDVARRERELVAELERTASGTVVLTGHGGALKALTASLIGLPDPAWSAIAPLRNCHWTELRRTDAGAWRLVAHNVYPLSDPSTLTTEELNVDSDAGDAQIGTPRPSGTDSAGR